jgi:hypothetical protein
MYCVWNGNSKKGTCVASIGLIITKTVIQLGSYKTFWRGILFVQHQVLKRLKWKSLFSLNIIVKKLITLFCDQILSSNSNMIRSNFWICVNFQKRELYIHCFIPFIFSTFFVFTCIKPTIQLCHPQFLFRACTVQGFLS